MKTVKKSQTLLVTFVFGFLASCGQLNPTDLTSLPQGRGVGQDSDFPDPEGTGNIDIPPRPPDEIHDQEKSNRVCYPGIGSAPICLNLIQPNDTEFQTHYRYRDPKTASDFPIGFDATDYVPPSKFLRIPDFASNLALSKNFGMQEFMSEVKGTYGIFSPYVVAALQKLRDMTRRSLIITSAYRSPSYNQSIGGEVWSRHIYGDGVDIAASDQGAKRLISASCRRVGAGFVLVYEGHVHCDWRTTRQAKEQSGGHDHSASEIEIMEVSPEQQIENTKVVDHFVLSALDIQVRILPVVTKELDDLSLTLKEKRRQVTLSARYADIEGEGVPELEWTITSNRGKTFTLSGQEVVFDAKPGQTYRIDLLMGGHYRINKSFDVPR